MKFLSSLLLTFSLFSTLSAAEVDQFTLRHEKLEDASTIINLLANRNVKRVLKEMHANQIGCDEKELYENLRTVFANHSHGELTISVIDNPAIPKLLTPFEKSIYKDWRFWDGFVMGSPFFKKSGLTISPLIRMGDVIVGTDKFEHMFGRGFQYFTNFYLKNKNLETAVKRGVFDEKLIFGGNKIATGVFSYGDLSANFNGMRFWNHMLQLRPDVLGDSRGPYIACENNHYRLVKEIDFRSYMDESMDEGINCAKFPSHKTAMKYKRQVEKLGMTCPMDLSSSEKMIQKYGPFSKWIINSKGFEEIDYNGEFEE